LEGLITLTVDASSLHEMNERLMASVPLALVNTANDLQGIFSKREDVKMITAVSDDRLDISFLFSYKPTKPPSPKASTTGKYQCRVHLYSGGTIILTYELQDNVPDKMRRIIWVVLNTLIKNFDMAIIWSMM
jgi:hypothetical protein